MIPLPQIRKIVMCDLQPLCVYGFYKEYKKDHFNIEHIIPQSFDPRIKGDMHTIFMCDKQLNNFRSNYSFIEDVKRKKNSTKFVYLIYQNGTYYTSSKRDHYYCAFSHFYGLFVPPESSRGMIARSLLYYMDKYKSEDIVKKIVDIRLLSEWNRKYGVTEMEYLRNEEIFQIQENRNPFIYFGSS